MVYYKKKIVNKTHNKRGSYFLKKLIQKTYLVGICFSTKEQKNANKIKTKDLLDLLVNKVSPWSR